MPHLWPTGSSLGLPPSTTARYFSAYLSDSTSRWTPCPPKSGERWLQVRLGCVRLSPSCPVRLLHTFLSLRPARRYPRFWIRRPSSERRRDFNPPDLRTAQHTLRGCPTSRVRSPSVLVLRLPDAASALLGTGRHGTSRLPRRWLLCMLGVSDRAEPSGTSL